MPHWRDRERVRGLARAQVARASRQHWPLLSYCQIAKRRGLSAREALTIYRDEGGRIRTQTFHELYREAK